MDARKAAPRPDQRIVEIAYVREIRREDDLAALRAHHTVGDREESMQVLVSLGARLQQMVRVLLLESVIEPRDELHEDLVGLERLHVAGVQRMRLAALAAGNLAQARADEACLARSRRSLKNEHRLARIEEALDEGAHAACDLRIGEIMDHV